MVALKQVSSVQGTPLPDRYPGTLPFGDTPLDHLRFFGRESETRALLYQLLSADLLVLFAKAGLEKTSLLNARLFPPLREQDFLPLPVRFNHTDRSLIPIEVFTAAIEQACQANDIDYTPGTIASLWEFFKTAVFWRGDRLQTPVLVLDQFEEIFTLQDEGFRHATAAELGQLISGRLPEHVRQQIQAGEPLPFSEKPPEVKVLVSLREDNLGLLQELTPEIPTILQHRFRLTGLSETDAWQAIIEPAKLGSEVIEFATRPFEYTETTVKEMIAATRTKEGSIDPFFLQILCSHVEKQIPRKQNPGTSLIQVDPSYLGGEKGIQAITRKFYLDAIRRLPRGKFRRRARRLCEEGLLTADGHRRSVLEEDLEQFKLRPEALETLEALRLLRKEPRHGSFYYEISHDRLAEAIREVREERRGLSRKVKISFAMLTISLLLITIYLTGRLRTENLEKKVFVTLYNGGMQRAQGDPQAALSTYQKGVEIAEKPAVHIPANIERQRLLSITYDRIGKVQRAQGDLQAALSAYQKGLEIREQLAARDPLNTGWQRDLSVSYERIGDVQCAQGDLKAALSAYQKGLAIAERLAALKPQNTDWQHDLSVSYNKIGDVQAAQGDLQAALSAYQKGLEIREQLAARYPDNVQWQTDLAVSLRKIATVFEQQKPPRKRDAAANYQKALDILRPLAAENRLTAAHKGWIDIIEKRLETLKE